ncbi:MAG: glutaredoxin family protein [Betaproteobacteria bacterium]|nr:glutaredoxin family protein [Betaproteobacteria bacterium]
MKRLIWLGLLCTSMTAHAGEVYRWVGPSGITHYSDGMPPAGVQQAGRLPASKSSSAAPQEKPAVVLYAFACGPLCDDAKAWLNSNNIAYTLKDPQSDAEAATELKKLIGALEAPALKVGDRSFKGFDPNAWGQMLGDAGYTISKTTNKK